MMDSISSLFFNLYCTHLYHFLGLILVIITLLLTIFCIVFLSDKSSIYIKQVSFNIFLIQILAITLFLTPNLLIFYICFESILIPFFLIIVLWGSRAERIEAAFRLLFYTFIFSLPTLFFMALLLITIESLDFYILEAVEFSYFFEKILWTLLFLSFLVKAAIPPFHLWLVEAHVEAPTIGSILLSGLALKLGLYGIFCIISPIFYLGYSTSSKYIQGLSLVALLYPVTIILSQLDWKKIIAYFSVVHMALIFIGLFSNILSGFQGAIIITIIHSFVSPALFACVGFLYDRYHTKDITMFGRLADLMPVFAFITFILFLIEIAFPGTPNFIGEVLIFNSTSTSFFIAYFFLFPYYMFFAIFVFKIYASIFYDFPNNNILFYGDLNLIEFSSIFFIFLVLIIPTIYPQLLLRGAAAAFWALTL